MSTNHDNTKQHAYLTDNRHYVESRRLQWISDILEQCHCALWVLWEQKYEYCDVSEIPVSVKRLSGKLVAFSKMTQSERNAHRKYVADGLYDADGVDHPCPVCGFQAEQQEDI